MTAVSEDLLRNRGAFPVRDFCGWAGIGHNTFYKEVGSGRLKTRKIGRKTVVTATDALAWLDALPESA